ncbi:hypothetical protein K1719_000640 [Acacia pycnantha]|nr:hypothetical protein K1719_000640 [Acacia pycnantha]
MSTGNSPLSLTQSPSSTSLRRSRPRLRSDFLLRRWHRQQQQQHHRRGLPRLRHKVISYGLLQLLPPMVLHG